MTIYNRKEEVERRRKIAQKEIAKRKHTVSYGNGVYSEWRHRRLTPFFILSFVSFILFGAANIITKPINHIGDSKISQHNNTPATIQIDCSNKIIDFKIRQSLTRNTNCFSDLEIELLDNKLNHVYSFYKDLWKETFLEDGTHNTYRDEKMNFQIELPKGTYYLKAYTSYTDTPINISYGSCTTGNLYFNWYMWFFLGIVVISFLGHEYWGSPVQMVINFKNVKSLKNNRIFIISTSIIIIIFISCIIISFTHYGYAGNNNFNHAPTMFLAKQGVIYLG